MATKFTQDEIKALYAPFPLKDHSIREGNKNKDKTRMRWFVYLDRVAVQTKLDTLFLGDWEFTPIDTNRQPNYVNITATLSIRGVSRSFNGGSSNAYGDVTEDLEKGAMTDTFRRVASMWGLGAYLYNSVEIWTASYDTWQEKQAREIEAKRIFRDWYVAEFPDMADSANGNSHTSEPTYEAEEPDKPEPDAPTFPVGGVITWNHGEVKAAIKDWPNWKDERHTTNAINKAAREGKIKPTYTTQEAIATMQGIYGVGNGHKADSPK